MTATRWRPSTTGTARPVCAESSIDILAPLLGRSVETDRHDVLTLSGFGRYRNPDRILSHVRSITRTAMEETDVARRFTRRRLIQSGVGAFSALAVPTLISACGGSSGSGSSATTASKASETTGKRGGTLKYAAGDAQSKDSLDPALALTSIGTFALGMIYDTLLSVDVNWNLSPMLAVDHTISTDAKRHSFKLRRGVEFHSGKPFTSADVAAQYRRVLNPKTGSSGLSILSPVLEPSGISTPDPATIIF